MRPLVTSVLAVGLCVLGACEGATDMPPPVPPEFTAMTPTSGPYGTVVTITGAHFGERTGIARLALEGVPYANVLTWTNTEITFRYPFPASGDVSVTTASGAFSAGTFTPDAIAFEVSENLGSLPVAAAFFESGAVGAVLHGGVTDGDASVAIASASGDVASHDLATALGSLTPVDVFEATPGTLEGFFVGPSSSVYQLAWIDGAPLLRTTGLQAKSVLAAAHDAMGTFVWTATDVALERYRAPTMPGVGFVGDLGVTIPFDVQKATMSLRGALTADGTLFVTWGRFTGTLIDDEARPTLSRIVPSPLTWMDTDLAPEVDDAIVGTSTWVSPDGARVLSRYCYTDRDFDPYDPTDPEVERNCAGPLDVGATPITGALPANLDLLAFTATGFVAVAGSADAGFTLETGDASIALPIWPLEPAFVLHHDTHGTAIVVEGNGTYVIRPAP